jgi:ribosomal protein L7/L12
MATRGELGNIVSQSAQDGASPEMIAARLRDEGASKIESIRALCDGLGMSLSDAKRAIHFSPTWADTKELDEKIWRELEAALRDDLS